MRGELRGKTFVLGTAKKGDAFIEVFQVFASWSLGRRSVA